MLLSLFLVPGISAATSVISPSTPAEIVLNSSNNYEVKKEFDGTGSTPSSVTYSWSRVEEGVTKSGPRANFTFNTGDSATNTITLVVSSGSDSDSSSVTQTLRDVPRITYTDVSPESIDLKDSEGEVEFSAVAETAFDDSLDYEWTVDGTSVQQQNFTYDFNSTGDYAPEVNVTDGAGYYKSKQLGEITVSNSTETEQNQEQETQNDGTGNTGAGLPQQTDEPEAEESQEEETQETSSINFESPESAVEVRVDAYAENLELDVERMDVKPSRVSNPPGEAFGYIEINSNASDQEIERAEVDFSVDKDWIDSRQIDPDQVFLMRYNGGWQELETSVDSQNSTHVSYTAETPGFSVFAVAAEDQESQDTENENQNEDQPDNPGNSGLNFLYLIPAAVFTVAVIGAFHYREDLREFMKKRRTRSKIEEVTERLKKEVTRDQEIDIGLLEQAEELFERGDYSRALRKLRKLEDQVQNS